MEFTLSFLIFFFYGLSLVSPILLSLMLFILLLGQRVGKKESWTRLDALYWSFITATTVGYGDFRPATKMGKVLSIFIAFTGLIFTGIVVAIALQAATEAFKLHMDADSLKKTVETISK